MMFRKFTALLFLSLASIIMLAFAVVPHHHHQEYICFNSIHCEKQDSPTPHSHDEAPEDSDHGCVRNLFQTQISRVQTLAHPCEDGHCFHFIQALFLSSDILTLLSLEAENKTTSFTPYEEKLYSACYTSDLAGRAPPYKG